MEDIRHHRIYYLSRIILLTVGSLISAFAIVTFFLPSSIAPLGVTGLAVILQELFNTPIGLVVLLANIPIQFAAFRELSGWKTVAFTLYTVILYSVAIEVMQSVLPALSLTDDAILNAVCGGVVGGIGGGLIYRAGGTVGGTSTIAQMLRQRFGLPLSAASMFSDTFIVLLAGAVLGWEAALYALIAVFVNRIIADYVLEGPNDASTAVIITDMPDQLCAAVAEEMQHSATSWRAQGGYSDDSHHVVMVSMRRPEIHALRQLVRSVDDSAFVTILAGQAIYGNGFKSMYSQMPLRLDEVDA